MTCREVTGMLSRGGVPSEEARKHAAACPSCGPLIALFEPERLLESAELADASLANAIADRITAGLKPVKPLMTGRILAMLALVFVLAVVGGALHWHVFGPEAMSWLQRLVLFPALGVGAVLLAISLARQLAPGSRHVVRPSLVPVIVLAVLVMLVLVLFRVRAERHYLANGLWCLKAGSLAAFFPAVLFGLVLRRGALLEPVVVGAAAGALAGLAGTTVLALHCPNMNMLHVLVWHLGPALLGTAAGAVFGALGRLWSRRGER